MFLGLSATTLTLLKHEGMATGWANSVRFTLLALAVAWSLKMGARIIAQRHGALWQNAMALAATALGLVPFVWAWILFFVVW